MENPKRGELTIVLGEKKYKGKVTMDVIMRIENSCGMGIVKITNPITGGVDHISNGKCFDSSYQGRR